MIESPKMLPRTIERNTPLVENGRCEVAIIYPAQEAAYGELARQLAAAIELCTGARPAVVADVEVFPSRGIPLPDEYRRRPLILLGNLNTNCALPRHYANYYCATDAVYPGGDGYDLRTMVNPYGAGSNIILAGGSSLQGVRHAVEQLIDQIRQVAHPGELTLPFLMDIKLDPALDRALMGWPDTPLSVPLPTLTDDQNRSASAHDSLLRAIGSYAIHYAWTGDERYGFYARDCLRLLNAAVTNSYGDWHYRAERVLRALPWLCAGGLLDEGDILRTDELLLGTALGTEDMWWRMRDGRPPLGHRHQCKGTFEFLLLAYYLRDQARPNDTARDLCDRWINESQAFLDGLAQAASDDQDDESTLNNMAILYWYALGQERFDFFEGGNARVVAQRAIALHDNMGAGAGQGGYGEGLPGWMYFQQEATVLVAACALYYQDGRFKWLLENLPHLNIPLRRPIFSFEPIFMHKFDTGAELSSVQPDDLSGLQILPITSHQLEINNHPPERIEPMGHAVNKLETWLKAEGIGVNTLPRECGFGKIVLRSGFAPHDAYLLLQGYQGGYRWQGHMQAANCIVRFSQGGHIFLIQNTTRHSAYDKNGLFISDGYNTDPVPPIAEWLAIDNFLRVGLSATRLADYHHADWTRHIFWSKAGEGFFVVIDSVMIQKDGSYSMTCTWRTPGYASLEGRTWQARQGNRTFTLRCSEDLAATSAEERDQGGAAPYVLRQCRDGEFRAGESVTFQNLFYVRSLEEPLDILRLDVGQVLVSRNAIPFAWCGMGGEMRALGLSLQTVSAWVTADEIALTGATHLSLDYDWQIESDRPVGVYLDLTEARLTLRVDGRDPNPADVQILIDGQMTNLIVDREAIMPLPAAACRQIAQRLQQKLSDLRPAGETQNRDSAVVESSRGQWHVDWSFDQWTPINERIRNLTASASPEPLDGFSEQLTDSIISEMRDIRRQWPDSPHYEITLTLPDEMVIDHLRIVGDSYYEPTLRVFNPLPDGITVSGAKAKGDWHDFQVDPEPGVLRFKRYRDVEDHMDTRNTAIGHEVRRLRVNVPAPPEGRPLVLHEIEVYAANKVLPPIQNLLTVDLDGDGRLETIIVNAANDLVVLAEDGRECWRQRLDGSAPHISCHDLDGDGRLSLCLGMLSGDVRILRADGTLRQTIPLRDQFRQLKDVSFGWFSNAHEIAVWNRDANGRAGLVIGGYALIIFLDPDGQIIGHNWADGSWQTNILVSPPDRLDAGTLWVRNGWCHGICVYKGSDSFAPSREAVTFGGLEQPMFRGLRRVIPFVHGKTTTFDWLGSDSILAAADSGIGVLSTSSQDWRWKIEGGAPITACLAANGEVIAGGADGFAAAFDSVDGRPLRRVRVGAPVVGMAYQSASGTLVVGTQRGVLVLSREWEIHEFYSVKARRLWGSGENGVLLERVDGVLERVGV